MMRALAGAMFLQAVFAAQPVAADPWSRTLVDGFDGHDFSAQGGLYYRENEEQRAGTVEFQKAVTYSGAGALKLSVRPNCANAGDNCSERAEIWEKTELRVPYDQPVWYGFAVKFADPIPQDDHRYLIAQWKREIGPTAKGDFSPFLALRLLNGKLFVTVETNFHPAVTNVSGSASASCGALTPVWLRPDSNQMRAFVVGDSTWKPEDGALYSACTDKITVIDRGNDLPTPDSGWIDFAIMTRPGPDGTGHIELFANGRWIRTIKGHIGHNDPGLGRNQYFKFGPYRGAGKGEWSVYYDDFRRSRDCRDVLPDWAECTAAR